MSKASERLDAPYALMLNESELTVLRYVLASVDLKTGEQRPIKWGQGKSKRVLLEVCANLCSKAVIPSRPR